MIVSSTGDGSSASMISPSVKARATILIGKASTPPASRWHAARRGRRTGCAPRACPDHGRARRARSSVRCCMSSEIASSSADRPRARLAAPRRPALRLCRRRHLPPTRAMSQRQRRPVAGRARWPGGLSRPWCGAPCGSAVLRACGCLSGYFGLRQPRFWPARPLSRRRRRLSVQFPSRGACGSAAAARPARPARARGVAQAGPG